MAATIEEESEHLLLSTEGGAQSNQTQSAVCAALRLPFERLYVLRFDRGSNVGGSVFFAQRERAAERLDVLLTTSAKGESNA